MSHHLDLRKDLLVDFKGAGGFNSTTGSGAGSTTGSGAGAGAGAGASAALPLIKSPNLLMVLA